MPDIVMPQLSDSMERGTILSWLKLSGDAVELGDEILEIETDKATVTCAAEVAGVLKILIGEGDTVAVGVPIATIGPAVAELTVAAAQFDSEAMAASETALVSSSAVELAALSAAPVPGGSNGSGHGLTATPLARRIAAVHGVNLDTVHGTGPLGRVTRADVLAHAGLSDYGASALPTVRPGTVTPTPAITGRPSDVTRNLPAGSSRREPSRLQALIARRMVEAKATVPHFQVQTDVIMDPAVALRADLKSVVTADDPVPSLNDLIIKAAAIALAEHPLANGSYQDDGFVLHEQINVGMAVAAEDALVVPTVFAANAKSIGQIARETRALAARVRDGQVSPADLEGGTFTVSNLGMLGMTAINPVVNVPQAAILGVGSLRETLARVDGEIVDRTLMTLTLSCDHRILYGAEAARFLSRIRELLETPLRLAL